MVTVLAEASRYLEVPLGALVLTAVPSLHLFTL